MDELEQVHPTDPDFFEVGNAGVRFRFTSQFQQHFAVANNGVDGIPELVAQV